MHLKYLLYVLRHKWFVFVECTRLGLFWRGIIHDLSKFSPREWTPYARYFYGLKYRSINDLSGDLRMWSLSAGTYREATEDAFSAAWLHHQNANDHHWQYWVLIRDTPQGRYTIQAIQPEVGRPWWLAEDNVRVAAFGEDEPLRFDMPSQSLILAERVKVLLDSVICLPMPDACRREMLADWRGAGRALGKPDTRGWYLANRRNIQLHPETREWVERELAV